MKISTLLDEEGRKAGMALLEKLRPIESTRSPALLLSGGRFDLVKRCRLWQVELGKAKSFTQVFTAGKSVQKLTSQPTPQDPGRFIRPVNQFRS